MAPAPAVILRHIRALAGAPTTVERTDHELLQYFAAGRDEAAFAALVRRHGSLVFSVCRHVLRHEQDAEDAFQATFLVLARKAASIHKKEAVGGWLHGVAYRTALNARRVMTRRRQRDQRAEGRTPEGPVAGASLHELQALLDAEVELLPNNYRVPFVLCCLEGRTKAEAARELGWEEGTVSSRLAKARERLRRRLARHGVTLSAVLTAGALVGDAMAAVPATLMAATVRSVLTVGALPAYAGAWAEGVLSIVSMVTWKAGATLALTLSMLAAGAFGYRQWASGEPQEEQPKTVHVKPAAEGRQPRADRYGDPLPAGAIARLGTVRFLHGGIVRSVAFSKDQKTLASAGDDKTVRLWDLTTGKEIRRFVGHDNWVYTVAFSPDGKILASAGVDQTIRLWEVATGREIKQLLGHEEEVNSIVFSPDGKVLASGSSDKTIRLWDVSTGRQERQCEGIIGWVGSVVFFPDGKTLISGSYEDGIHLWDVGSGKELFKPWLPRTGVLGTALSPDGKVLAANGKDDLGTSLWEVATGTMLRKLDTDRRESDHAVFSPDGTTLSTVGTYGPVRTWEVSSGKELSRSEVFERGATAMAISPDGKILVTGSLDHRVRLWQTSTGKQIYPFEGHTASVRSVDYGTDSKTLISAGYDGTVRVWDIAQAKEVRRFSPYRSNLHVPLALSPDRQTLVSTDLE